MSDETRGPILPARRRLTASEQELLDLLGDLAEVPLQDPASEMRSLNERLIQEQMGAWRAAGYDAPFEEFEELCAEAEETARALVALRRELLGPKPKTPPTA